VVVSCSQTVSYVRTYVAHLTFPACAHNPPFGARGSGLCSPRADSEQYRTFKIGALCQPFSLPVGAWDSADNGAAAACFHGFEQRGFGQGRGVGYQGEVIDSAGCARFELQACAAVELLQCLSHRRRADEVGAGGRGKNCGGFVERHQAVNVACLKVVD
jgi:hypothetical protein